MKEELKPQIVLRPKTGKTLVRTLYRKGPYRKESEEQIFNLEGLLYGPGIAE